MEPDVSEEWRFIEGTDETYRVSNLGNVERCFYDNDRKTGQKFLSRVKVVPIPKDGTNNPALKIKTFSINVRIRSLVYNAFAATPAPKGTFIYFLHEGDESFRFYNLTIVPPKWYDSKPRGRKPKSVVKKERSKLAEEHFPYKLPRHQSGKVPRIVSAAMRLDKLIIPCPRHNDSVFNNVLHWMVGEKGDAAFADNLAHASFEHGFIDQFGFFYDKKVALRIAQISGQVTEDSKKPPYDTLLPDDIY